MAKLTQSVNLTNCGRVAVITVDNPPVTARAREASRAARARVSTSSRTSAGDTDASVARCVLGWETVDRMKWLTHEGKMGAVIVVFPDCFTALGGNQYVNSSAIGSYERLVGQLKRRLWPQS